MIWLILGGAVVVGVLMLFFFASFGTPPGPTEAEKVRGRLMSKQAKDASRDVKRGKI